MPAPSDLRRRIDKDELVEALRGSGTVGDEAELVDFRARPIGVGHTADTLRVELEWADHDTEPTSLVAKIPSADPLSASTAAALGAYSREARFYADLAPRTTLSIPAYFGSLYYNDEPGGVLLEDLSGMEPGNQFGDTPVPTVRLMREQLASLQAPFWEDAVTAQTPWLHQRLGVPIPEIVERMEKSWRTTREYLANGFARDERAIIDRFVASAGYWAESLGSPFSLTHHDFRVDNMLFGNDRLVVLDWQTVGWGAPMFDVAYLLGTSLGSEARRTVERAEVARHVDDLAARGVSWSESEAWRAYRQASFAVLLMLVPPTGSVKRTERGDAMFRRLLQMGARMALDLEAEEFLPNA